MRKKFTKQFSPINSNLKSRVFDEIRVSRQERIIVANIVIPNSRASIFPTRIVVVVVDFSSGR